MVTVRGSAYRTRGCSVMQCGLQRRSCRAFTLLELMVVLLILALLGSIAAPRVAKHLSRAKAETARIQIDALGAAIEEFHLDNDRYPSTEEGLNALLAAPANLSSWSGPYVQRESSLIDPWKQPYAYKYPGDHRPFDIMSLGADRQPGGEGDAKDVGNW